MPSLRKRVSSYFRQLSFNNETRDKRFNVNENSFVTKYLQGLIRLQENPPVISGKTPTDLPNYDLGTYKIGPECIVGCHTGPNGGLATVKRTEKHLSIAEAEIDFIDTQEENVSAASDISDASSLTKPDHLLPIEWNRTSEHVYGLSDSLYDRNLVTKLKNGDPIADCFGVISRKDSAILAVADGVNWGEKACIAAKSAIHGSLHYLNKTIFNDTKPFESLNKSETPLHDTHMTDTRDVFVSLLRAFNCAHDLILENEGMLTTLTVAVILPLKSTPEKETTSFVCCCCNVGDTLAYVYSQKHGVREITKGSHDVLSNRDMRDALGALGPVDGINPELSNLTLSVTKVQKGDVVFIASDGLTDNFDPNVCKFAVNLNNLNKDGKLNENSVGKTAPIKPPRKHLGNSTSSNRQNVLNQNKNVVDTNLVKNFNRTLSVNDDSTISNREKSNYNFLRSKTSIDLRKPTLSQKNIIIQRNSEGLPFITPIQRYDLTLLLMEDILKNGISGRENRCVTAKKLCESLMSFTLSITAAKRRTLEDNELYFDNRNGVMVEVSNLEKKGRRKRALERVQNLPGKLDHVTVVAVNVGDFSAFR
nr:PP2C-like domain-containing protein CG9801 isoform X2 [Onthophagus taurus]